MSMLCLYRRLITLRHAEVALRVGRYRQMHTDGGEVLSYAREHGDRRLLVVLNLLGQNQEVRLKSSPSHGRVLLSTYLDQPGGVIKDAIELRADEGVIIAFS